MVARLSGYTDFRAGVAFHPATTFIAENCNQEKLYEVSVDKNTLNQFLQTTTHRFWMKYNVHKWF